MANTSLTELLKTVQQLRSELDGSTQAAKNFDVVIERIQKNIAGTGLTGQGKPASVTAVGKGDNPQLNVAGRFLSKEATNNILGIMGNPNASQISAELNARLIEVVRLKIGQITAALKAQEPGMYTQSAGLLPARTGTASSVIYGGPGINVLPYGTNPIQAGQGQRQLALPAWTAPRQEQFLLPSKSQSTLAQEANTTRIMAILNRIAPNAPSSASATQAATAASAAFTAVARSGGTATNPAGGTTPEPGLDPWETLRANLQRRKVSLIQIDQIIAEMVAQAKTWNQTNVNELASGNKINIGQAGAGPKGSTKMTFGSGTSGISDTGQVFFGEAGVKGTSGEYSALVTARKQYEKDYDEAIKVNIAIDKRNELLTTISDKQGKTLGQHAANMGFRKPNTTFLDPTETQGKPTEYNWKDTASGKNLTLVQDEATGEILLKGQLQNLIKSREKNKELADKAAKEAVALQERITAARGLPSRGKGKSALDMAQRYGFSPEDLKSVDTQAPSSITTMKFNQTAEGVSKNLQITTDKYGTVLADTQRRFRSFTQSLLVDIPKVAQWSLAVSLIYAPLYKLQQLMTIMIDNEQKMSEVMVAMTNSTKGTEEVFAAIAQTAVASGESINEVMQGYAAAYRVTGSIADQTKRFATANIFLADALVLSKISTLTSAESIDILSGALNQTGTALDKGRGLLDSWVKATKLAQVDLATLATGYSMLGDAAEAAGIKGMDLTGVLAAISQVSGGMDAKAIANTSAALLSIAQTDKGKAAFEAVGVSTTDYMTGKAKDFITLYTEVNKLIKSGAMGETQLQAFGNDAGGGSRRSKSAMAFASNMDIVKTVNEGMKDATGESTAAMQIQMDNVATATTNLGNSFQELAFILGEKGGLLDTFAHMENFLTAIVGGMNGVLGAVGKAGPALLLVGTAAALLWARPSAQKLDWAGKIGDMVGGILPGVAYTKRAVSNPLGTDLQSRMSFGTLSPTTTAQGTPYNPTPGFVRNALLGNLTGASKYMAAGATGLAIGGISALGQKDLGLAGANIAGGITGALITGGSPIGAAIGSAIAEAFVKGVAYKTDTANILKNPVTYNPTKPGVPAPVDSTNIEEQYNNLGKYILEEYAKKYSGGTSGLSIWLAQASIQAQKIVANSWLAHGAELAYGKNSKDFAFNYTPEQIAGAALPQEQQNRINDVITQHNAISAPTEEYNASLKKVNEAIPTTLQESVGQKQRQAALSDRLTGKITGAQYTQKVTALDSVSTHAISLIATLGDNINKLDKSGATKNIQDQYSFLVDLIVNGTPEAIDEINSLADAFSSNKFSPEEAVAALKKIVSEMKKVAAQQIKLPTVVDMGDFNKKQAQDIIDRATKEQIPHMQSLGMSAEDIQKSLDGIDGYFIELADHTMMWVDTISQDTLNRTKTNMTKEIQLPTVVGMGDISKNSFDKLLPEAKDYQQKWLETMQFTPEQAQRYIDSIQGYWVELENGLFVYVEHLSSDMLTKTADGMKKLGTLPKEFSLNTTELTSSQIPEMMQRYQQRVALLNKNFGPGGVYGDMGFKENATPTPFEMGDKTMRVFNVNSQLLLDVNQEMLNELKKQNGLFNMPEGASFWFNSGLLDWIKNGLGGTAGTGDVTNASLAPTTVPMPHVESTGSGENVIRPGQVSQGGITNPNWNMAPGGPSYTSGTYVPPDFSNEARLTESLRVLKETATGIDLAYAQHFLDEAEQMRQYNPFTTIPKEMAPPPPTSYNGARDYTGYPTQSSGGGNTSLMIGQLSQLTSAINTSPLKLNVNFESTTTLMLPEKIITDIVQRAVANILLRNDRSQGSTLTLQAV